MQKLIRGTHGWGTTTRARPTTCRGLVSVALARYELVHVGLGALRFYRASLLRASPIDVSNNWSTSVFSIEKVSLGGADLQQQKPLAPKAKELRKIL